MKVPGHVPVSVFVKQSPETHEEVLVEAGKLKQESCSMARMRLGFISESDPVILLEAQNRVLSVRYWFRLQRYSS